MSESRQHKHNEGTTKQSETVQPMVEEITLQSEAAAHATKSVASGAPPTDPKLLLHLQRTLGNQAVQRMIAQGQIQQAQPRKRTLPPLVGATQRKQEEAEPKEGEQAEPIVTTATAPTSTPPDDSVQAKAAPAATQIQSQANPPQVQRLFGIKLPEIPNPVEAIFKTTLSSLGEPGKMVAGLLKSAGDAFMNIVKNPGGFLKNLIMGVKNGFSQFSANILTHLKKGFMSWLFGTVAKAGVQVPKDFSLPGIFQLVTQIIGLTVDKVKERLRKFIGEKNAQRIEAGFGMLNKFISNGVGGMWELVKGKFADLKETVVDEIQDWVAVQVIKNAVVKIASMFNPASGLTAIIKSIYNIMQWLINNGQRLAGLFKAVSGTIGSIAHGAVSGVANKIEGILANSIPVAIGFFASLLGISGLANKISGIVRKIQQRVEDAIDAVIKRIAKRVKAIFSLRARQSYLRMLLPQTVRKTAKSR